MLYYKYADGSGYISCQEEPTDSSLLINIPKQEYEEYMASIEPTEEEIRAQKEELALKLLKELYPEQDVETMLMKEGE